MDSTTSATGPSEPLTRLAAAHGVATDYWDWQGRHAPISAETISGLSRVLRGNLQAAMQDAALWHERDISHSSVERVVLPDSSMLAYYVLRRGRRLLNPSKIASML